MDAADRLQILQGVPLFRKCTNRELRLLDKIGNQQRAAAGTIVVREGDPGHECYVILEGDATVSRNNRKVSDLGPGDAFGELALLAGGARIATVKANSDLLLLMFDKKSLSDAVLESPALAMKLLEQLATRLREADRRAFG